MAGSATCPTCGEATEALTCAACGGSIPAHTDQIRDQAALERDETAKSRDRAAELRDRGAEDRDVLARQHGQAASDRDEIASAQGETRLDEGDSAARDREDAAHDREDAAHDREDSARDRIEALQVRQNFADAAQRAVETLESMSDAFFTLDDEWRFTYLNPQSEIILERRREDLLGRNVWEELPEAVNSAFGDEYRRAVREQVPVRFEEVYEPLGRTLEVRAYPVPAGLAVYFTDVTNERLRDARLRQTERLETLGRVTAGVAHDFNNLLAAVSGFAQLGQAKAVDETTAGYFAQINGTSKKALALTRQLLTFAREQDLSPAVIDMNDVVKDLSPLLNQLIPAGIDIPMRVAPDPVTVFVDRSQLEQVLVNLVVNSRDAIGATGSITISTMNDAPTGTIHEVHAPSGWLQVTDTGAGIPKDVLPHIFDPFFTTKPPETGTGLGLATIYGIVSQSGGSIFVDSTIDVGTTMTVVLPRADSRGGYAHGTDESSAIGP